MPKQPIDHLEILGQLAREYEQKYNELQEFLKETQPESAVHQLMVRAELTTGRFRAAQQALFSSLVPMAENAEPLKAATALCRGFDEMRILFQTLLDYYSMSKRSVD